MKIEFPVPSPRHVEEFRRLVREKQGIELSEEEAYGQCANLVRYVFLTERVLPALRKAKKKRH